MMVTILKSVRLGTFVSSGLLSLYLAVPAMADDGAMLLANNSLAANSGYVQEQTFGQNFGQNLVVPHTQIKKSNIEQQKSAAVANRFGAAIEDIDPKVDISALYYYAKQGQHARVDAEIVRLATLHPGFKAPSDLYERASRIAPDESHLWALFAQDDFAAIDAEFSKQKLRDPNWQPSDDFANKLSRKRLRVQMVELARLEDWVGVLNIGQSIDPQTETNIDLVWLLIDAYAELGHQHHLHGAYQGLLSRGPAARLSDQDLIATLQRATRDFPAIDVQRAMMSLWPNAQQMPQLAPLKLSLARRAVADFNQNDAVTTPPPGLDIDRLIRSATSEQNISDLSLIGWYYLKLKDYDQALLTFERLLSIEPASDPAKGYYLALARKGEGAKAYQFAKENVLHLSDDPEFLMNVLSGKLTRIEGGQITDDMIKAYSRAILETKAADHSEILAWYAYNAGQFGAARAWFEKSVQWKVGADNLKGLALSYRKLGETELYQALQQDYQDNYSNIWPSIEKVSYGKRSGVQSPTQTAYKSSDGGTAASGSLRANEPAPKDKASASTNPVKASYIRAYERKDYRTCLAELEKRAAKGLSSAQSLIQGWCYLAMSRISDAQSAFARAMIGKGDVRQDAIYGKALSLLRVRQTDDAEALIRTYPLERKRQDELLLQIYFQRARAAFDLQNFEMALKALNARAKIGPEPRDLTLMRAWSLHNLGERRAANALFQRLNAHMRDDNATYGTFVTKG